MSEIPENLPEFEVKARFEDSVLTGRVDRPAGSPLGAEIAFYLIRDGRVSERRRYSEAATASFLLKSTGQYAIKAFLKDGNAKVAKLSNEIAVEEVGFVSPRRLPELPFTRLDLPHQDIAVLQTTGRRLPLVENSLADIEDATGLATTRAGCDGDPTFVIHGRKADCGSGEVFFSGMTCTDDRFVFGPEDVDPERPDELHEGVGDFMLVAVGDESVSIRTDHFGVGKVYYYVGQGVACAANRMHLLLEVLAAVGVSLRPNATKIRAGLQATSQVFTQNFSSAMDLDDCFCLSPGSALRIRAGEIEILPTAIAAILDEPTDQVLGSQEYEELLQAGCEEMIRNLRLALEHPVFERVRLDVTGGLDSRMLFAALAQLPEFAGQVELHTADFPTSPHDLPISLRLSRDTGFRYDTGRRETYDVDSDTSLLENVSLNLGTYFGIRGETTRTRLPGTLCVNGFYGEVSARPYFARLVYGQPTESLDPRDYPAAHLGGMGAQHLTMSVNYDLTSYYRDEFERMPGSSSAAKFDAFYLFHRNGLHCSDRWMSHVRAPSWGPLQSRALFALKWRTLDTFRDITVQVDATEKLNRDLALVPLGRDRDNADRASISDVYPSTSNDMWTQLGITDEDMARFKEGGKQRRNNAERLRGADSLALQAKNSRMLQNHREWVIAGIDELETEHRLVSPTEAEELRVFVNHEYRNAKKQTRPAGTVITAKVLSAVYQCRAARRTAGLGLPR